MIGGGSSGVMDRADSTSIKLHELVAAYTSTKAGLSDSILVTQPAVGLWCRQEFHANSTKMRHPLR